MRFAVIAGLVLVGICLALMTMAGVGIGLGFAIHACFPAIDLGSSVISGCVTLLVATMVVVGIIRFIFALQSILPDVAQDAVENEKVDDNEEEDDDLDDEMSDEDFQAEIDHLLRRAIVEKPRQHIAELTSRKRHRRNRK